MISIESLVFRVQRLVSICLLFSVGCLHAQTLNTKLSTLNTQQNHSNQSKAEIVLKPFAQ